MALGPGVPGTRPERYPRRLRIPLGCGSVRAGREARVVVVAVPSSTTLPAVRTPSRQERAGGDIGRPSCYRKRRGVRRRPLRTMSSFSPARSSGSKSADRAPAGHGQDPPRPRSGCTGPCPSVGSGERQLGDDLCNETVNNRRVGERHRASQPVKRRVHVLVNDFSQRTSEPSGLGTPTSQAWRGGWTGRGHDLGDVVFDQPVSVPREDSNFR